MRHGRASTHTATLVGTQPVCVEVQVDVGSGLPAFSIVGLGDTAVLEARERVRSAIRAQGYLFPNARVVVNLAPAPLRKHGTGFDLPIAAGILAATGQIPDSVVDGTYLVGELSLDGAVSAVPGMLAHAFAARSHDQLLIAPTGSSTIAAFVPGVRSQFVRSLSDLDSRQSHPTPDTPRTAQEARTDLPDLCEVAGHEMAKRTLEIAAAGEHNVLFVGPPGSGKTMLARRLPGLLPPLSDTERLESALIHSVAGLDDTQILAGARPFRAPHHSASVAGLVGGGSPPRPGEASLAHNGVLFLDELAEFGPASLQSLRQPMEDAHITLVRSEGRVTFPARFALIGSANPCPCGHYGDPDKPCTCAPALVARYSGRIGGPLLDRIDLHLRVERIDPARILGGVQGESSSTVRERILEARTYATSRGRGPSSTLSGTRLLGACRLDRDASQRLADLARLHRFSGRAVTRLLRVARTIADLVQADRVETIHILEAASYRHQEGR